MAKLTRFQIGEQSDDTFFDNSTGGIVPENHRIFNNDLNESFANLKDSNTFEGENTFQDTIQGDGGANFTDKVTMTAQFVQNQVSLAIVITNNEVDLTNVEGNTIFIQGTDSISNWVGNVGAIFNATFYDAVYLEAQNGATILPNQNIKIYGGDTLIFRFRGVNQIQILGLKRDGGDFFQLNSISDFQTLIDAQALQIGAFYFIPQGYDIWGELWDIIFFAKTQGSFDGSNVRVAIDKGFYIIVQCTENEEDNALQPFIFASYVGVREATDINKLTNDQISDPRYYSGSTATLLLNDFLGDVRISNQQKPIFSNLINLYEAEKAYVGKIIYNPFITDYEFHPHSGNSLNRWGTNSLWKDGITATALKDIQVGGSAIFSNQSLVNIAQVNATYQVVNENVTINFYALVEGKFNIGTNNHEFWLYFPLPFVINNINTWSGFGVVRNNSDANFPDQGALVIWGGTSDYYCKLISKHSNQITQNKFLYVSGSFSYETILSV
jgi:hypothetical protein